MAGQEEGNADEGEHEDERYGEQDTHPVEHRPTPPTLLGPALLASHAHLACLTAVLRHARSRRGALSPSCASPDPHARSGGAFPPRSRLAPCPSETQRSGEQIGRASCRERV